MTTEEMWDTLISDYGVSEDTLKVVTDVAGYSASTLEAVLYSVAGLNSFDQIDDEEDEDEGCVMGPTTFGTSVICVECGTNCECVMCKIQG